MTLGKGGHSVAHGECVTTSRTRPFLKSPAIPSSADTRSSQEQGALLGVTLGAPGDGHGSPHSLDKILAQLLVREQFLGLWAMGGVNFLQLQSSLPYQHLHHLFLHPSVPLRKGKTVAG